MQLAVSYIYMKQLQMKSVDKNSKYAKQLPQIAAKELEQICKTAAAQNCRVFLNEICATCSPASPQT